MKRLKIDKPENIVAALAIGYGLLSLNRRSSRIKIASVKLPMSVVNKWLETGAVKEFVFQFSTPNFKADKPLKLAMYVQDENGTWLNAMDPYMLEINACTKFDKAAILGNNTVTPVKLLEAIKDSSGNKRKYDYILFTPLIDSVYHHIIYDFHLYLEGKKLPSFVINNQTNPCPPGCHQGNM
ncbi:MAG: hypothetical protein M3139_09410 [Bacteroidota bacterium]|nr:hypothetical protein [Bacteroidota bacterium]